jgi:hypothetical protein
LTVPTPAEFSENDTVLQWICFHKLKLFSAREKFGRYATSSSRAYAAILTQVTGFGKSIVALFGFWMWAMGVS